MNQRYLILLLALPLLAILYVVKSAGDRRAAHPIPDPHAGHNHAPGEHHLDEEPSTGPASKSRDRLEDGSGRAKTITTASGLQYQVLVAGTGPQPGPEDRVQVHYEGTLPDGTVFDSSHDRGAPTTFPLNAVIKGWQEGLQLMRVGGKTRFIIPPDLAYGERDLTPTIPANATLTFEIELLSINIVGITDGRIEMPDFTTRRIEPGDPSPPPNE